MKVDLVCNGNAAVLRVIGTLNLHSLKEFDQQTQSLDLNGLQTVTLDLQELDHIDSSGVSGIIQLHKHLMNLNISLQVGNISNRVKRLFDQMRLFEIIPKV
ncbi:MAG: STAS domain-containing protein [Candidatus Riflebacteria bacterium]